MMMFKVITESWIEREYLKESENLWFNEFTFLDEAKISQHFCWLPRRCSITGNIYWLQRMIRGRRTYTGPGEPVHEDHYYEPREFLMLKLRGGF